RVRVVDSTTPDWLGRNSVSTGDRGLRRPGLIRVARILVAASCLALALAASANATLTAQGDLFVWCDGSLTPTTLPRHHRAPAAWCATPRPGGGGRPPP